MVESGFKDFFGCFVGIFSEFWMEWGLLETVRQDQLQKYDKEISEKKLELEKVKTEIKNKSDFLNSIKKVVKFFK